MNKKQSRQKNNVNAVTKILLRIPRLYPIIKNSNKKKSLNQKLYRRIFLEFGIQLGIRSLHWLNERDCIFFWLYSFRIRSSEMVSRIIEMKIVVFGFVEWFYSALCGSSSERTTDKITALCNCTRTKLANAKASFDENPQRFFFSNVCIPLSRD